MQSDQSIEANHAAFQQLLSAVEQNVERSAWEAAMQCATAAANWAWLHSCGVFASPELEALLARIGAALPDPPLERRESGRRHVLTVVSGAYAVGGHTRLAARWMALDHDSRHTLVLTRQGGAELPAMIAELVERGTIELVVLDEPGRVERAAHLRRLLASSDCAVLHIHPDDPVPVVALAGMAHPPPVLFENHADHVFWIGAGVSNLLVSLHDDGSRIAYERRGISPANVGWLPIPLDLAALDRVPPVDIRAEHGIPADAVLLLSCASAYKFAPIDDVSMPQLLAPLLDEREEVHVLLVGPESDPPGTRFAEAFPGRVHYAGRVGADKLHAAYHACDVYLDAVPTSSSTALCEAVAAGKPALKYCLRAWSEAGFSMDMDAIPLPLYVSHDADAFRSELCSLIDSPSLRAERGQIMADMLRMCHGDAHFRAQLEAMYRRAAQLPRIELDASRTVQQSALLDVLLHTLAENLEASRLQEQSVPLSLVARQMTPEEHYRRLLGSRRILPDQASQAIARMQDVPAMQVVVFDPDRDGDGLERTMQSLYGQLLPASSVTVVSEADVARRSGVHAVEPDGEAIAQFDRLVRASDGEWFLPLFAGDVLEEGALLLLADALAAHPQWMCCYLDEDAWSDEGPVQPILKPDANLDLLRSYPYIGRHLAIRRSALEDIGGLHEQAGELALVDAALRLLERHGTGALGHLAEIVLHAGLPYAQWLARPAVAERTPDLVGAHLARLGIAHEVQPGVVRGVCRVRYLHERQPPVSIIIPTRDQLPLLNAAVDSLLAKTRYTNYELLIVDNNSQDPAACAYLDGIEKLNSPQLRVLRYPHPFNYSAINNFAAAQARGEYLVLLNNDTAILHDDWIDALLNHAQRPEVGIVGAKLHYPDGRIQHAGVVLGMQGPAGHPFIGEPIDAAGYMQRLQVDQNYTAVTAACLMIRKSVYEEVGGLDEEQFKVSYNDVDLCLKVHQAGYLNVWTPYAMLMHEGSVSQTKVDTTARAEKQKRFLGEQEAMYRKWMPLLARDPAYNRNLGLRGAGFELDERRNLSWQPFSEPLLPRVFCVAGDAYGCGHYRIRQPFAAMQGEGLAEGCVSDIHLAPVEMERFQPHAIVLQRQLEEPQLAAMRRYRDAFGAFKVYELDDYLPNVPVKSEARARMPKDLTRTLRQALSMVDRFVVSTEPLAEAFAGFHEDIRVVPNRLPVHWWGDLSSRRRAGSKPRVGWAGGATHRGDLDLIADVVRDLADEVEWVFFGMCPEQVREYVHEVHPGVRIGKYPAMLASLNLDLALAPVEDNAFNRCKSNLRLLEYGACGFPVICSDVLCYQGDLPVTRVKNRYKDWVAAIRMHLDDLDESARLGDQLRQAVARDWMLTGNNLADWRNAWMPS